MKHINIKIIKKITFLITSLAGGGAEGVCVNLANGLAQNGWNVELIVLHMNNSVYHENLDARVNLVVLNVNNARYSLISLIKYFRKVKLEKIVVFNYELTVMTLIARYFCYDKFKVISRNINTISKNQVVEKSFSYKAFLKKMVDIFYKKSDFIVNQSNGMMEDLISVYPDIRNKTQVIYNPVRLEIEKHGKSIDFENIIKDNYILCVGRLEHQKAFHFAIEAFSKIVIDFPSIRLKIVGQGFFESDLKKMVKELSIENSVDFEGFQKNMISYYINAKLVLLTSLYEGFPNVLIESISLGTPVVAFDCPSGPKEIVIEGKNGYLVEYLSTNDLSKKIHLALNTQWNYKVVYESSFRYKMTTIIQQWESLINEV